MKNAKYKIIYLVLFILMNVNCQNASSLDEIEKIKIYYKNDELFHMPVLEGEYPYQNETSYAVELFDSSLVTVNYQQRAKEYLKYLNEFVKNNTAIFKEYIERTRRYKGANREQVDNIFIELFKDKFENIFKDLKNCIRVIIGYETSFIYSYPRKIGDDEYVALRHLTKTGNDKVWWEYNYMAKYMNKEAISQYEGRTIDRRLNQDWWFYESNIKLVVVHKIKDEAGNYYGEMELDFYKIDEFDKYFTPEGKPKEECDAFWKDQKKRYFEWVDRKGK